MKWLDVYQKTRIFSVTKRNKTKKSKLKRGAVRCLYKIQFSSLLKEWKQEVQNKITRQFDVLKWENPNPLTRGSQEVQTKNKVVKKIKETLRKVDISLFLKIKRDVQILKMEKLKKSLKWTFNVSKLKTLEVQI